MVANYQNNAKIEKSLTVKLSNSFKEIIYKYADLIITNSKITTMALKQIIKKINIITVYNLSLLSEIIKQSKEKK